MWQSALLISKVFYWSFDGTIWLWPRRDKTLKFAVWRRKLKNRSGGVGELGRTFLEFRHKHESWWEILEAVLVAIVFFLMFVSEAASHIAGIISHSIVAVLLLVKGTSAFLLRLQARYGRAYDV
jgi:hypothetical protein